jgi:hypothetical protein
MTPPNRQRRKSIAESVGRMAPQRVILKFLHDAKVTDRAPLSGAPRDGVARSLGRGVLLRARGGADHGGSLLGFARTGRSRRCRRAGPRRDTWPLAFAVSRMLRGPAIRCSIVGIVPAILPRAGGTMARSGCERNARPI